MIISILGPVIFIIVLLSPLVLLDILYGWTFLIYPLYILCRLDLQKLYDKDLMENSEEPADGWHDTKYFSGMQTAFIATTQSISALVFFIIFALNDGADAFSTVIIGSIFLAIFVSYRRYFKPIEDSYKKLIVWIFSLYKKYLSGN